MSQSISITDSANLGASVAERFGKAVSPGERQLSTFLGMHYTHILNLCKSLSRHLPVGNSTMPRRTSVSSLRRPTLQEKWQEVELLKVKVPE